MRRWAILGAALGLPSLGTFGLFLSVGLVFLVPVIALGGLLGGASGGHAGSGFAALCAKNPAVCLSGPGPGTASWDGPGVHAVTVTWLPLEEEAVSQCAVRAEGPCVPVPFVEAVMMQESSGDPTAVSSAGALGLMQEEPSHFGPAQDPLDPATNVDVGVQFLDSLDRTFDGNLPLVAAGYNAGPGEPEAWEEEYGTSDWADLALEPGVQAFASGQAYEYVAYVMAYFSRFSAASGSPGGAS